MRLLFYVFILAIVLAAGLFLHQNPGDVEIAYQDWVIQMPLWIPVLGTITIIFVLSLVYSFFAAISRTYRRFRDWITGSTLRAITKNANQAWTAFTEGEWHKAEAGMLKAAKHSEYPLHYYLTAARAAQELSAIDRRDNYIHLAYKVDPEARLAVGLTQAELQLQQEQYEYSLATLQELQKTAPNNPVLLRLLVNAFIYKEEWQEIIKLLPQLKKNLVLSTDEYAALECKVYGQVLRIQAKNNDKQGFIDFWETLPKSIKQQSSIVADYAEQLLFLGAISDAEYLIRSTLKRQWDVRLVKLYGQAVGTDLGKQITTAESWLDLHRSEPALLLTLARLCLANKLWGKARSYLEASLAIQANPDAYAELGRLLGFLGEQQKSLDCYRSGLMEFASVLQLEGITQKT